MKSRLAVSGADVHAAVMRITDEALNEFVELYRDEFGEILSRSEASEMAFRLVTLYEALVRELPGLGPTEPPRTTPRSAPIGFRV